MCGVVRMCLGSEGCSWSSVPGSLWVGGGLASVVVGRTIGCVEGGGYLGCRGHVIAIGAGCSSGRSE